MSDSPSGSDFERWRKRLSWLTGLGLTPEEAETRRRESARQLDESLVGRCEKIKRNLFETSCPVTPEHVQCGTCDDNNNTSGGYDTQRGSIRVCANGFSNRKHMQDTIVHELLHMYDHCKFKVDWSNLRHHACSEIRAASLSGDCRWGREINRFFFSFSKQHQVCARRRAIISVAANPACPSEGAAEQAVNEVWESCFKDTRPFDEIY